LSQRACDEKVHGVGERASSRDEGFLREVNENIERAAERLGVHGDSWRFLCECGRPGCRETVELTLDEYEDVSAHGLLLSDGHRRSAGEQPAADQSGLRAASSVSKSSR
jgi:hypothetical protein